MSLSFWDVTRFLGSCWVLECHGVFGISLGFRDVIGFFGCHRVLGVLLDFRDLAEVLGFHWVFGILLGFGDVTGF